MQLLKGTGRGKVEANDIGLIFCTTVKSTAEKYAYWGSGGEVVTFDVRDDLNIADLNNEATARRIVSELATWEAIEDEDAYVADLVNNNSGDEITIMDDPHFRMAVAELGYDGATQDGHYALFAEAL
jgi:hypothetical protein